MNQQRRKTITKIMEDLENLKKRIESVQEEEQTAYDNLPESLQESDNAMQMQDCIQYLDDAMYSLDETIDHLNNI